MKCEVNLFLFPTYLILSIFVLVSKYRFHGHVYKAFCNDIPYSVRLDKLLIGL